YKINKQHIVDTIGSIDRLIEINNTIIAKIEEHISHIFALIYNPNEEYEILEDHCQVVLGGTPSRAKSEYWNGDIPWINSGEVNRDSIYFGIEYITKLGLQKSATKLMPKNTVVLAITGATLGQVSILKIDACANQSVVGILEAASLPYEFLLPLTKYKIRDLMSNQTGGAQQHINKNDVCSMFFNKPSLDIMKMYLSITKDILILEEKIQIKNNYLKSIRQILLTKYF
ncbi:MAG: restriction endonuclease subunit S, partial [Candidatus Izemoplasmatales bacterium]